MYSINLSLSKKLMNILPDNYIVNLKQLSENIVRIQLAHQNTNDKMRIVHSNSKTFREKHPFAYTADVSLPITEDSADDEGICISHAQNWGAKTVLKINAEQISISDFFFKAITILAQANGLAIDTEQKEILYK